MHRKLLTFILSCAITSAAFAGILSMDGTEPDFWNDHAIICARVLTVGKPTSANSRMLSISPMVTISGNFDCAQIGVISVSAIFEYHQSELLRVPEAPSMAILVLIKNKDGTYRIEESQLLFMPKGAGILPIENLADPKVDAMVETIRKVRHDEFLKSKFTVVPQPERLIPDKESQLLMERSMKGQPAEQGSLKPQK